MDWQAIKDRLYNRREDALEAVDGDGKLHIFLIVLSVYLLICIGVGIYWSSEPVQFSVEDNARYMASAKDQQIVVGSTTTAALIRVTTEMLDKRGGFISNDIFPPGVWMDNIPNWEYGVLIQVRDLAKAMRDGFSRSQTQSTENDLLARAEPRLNFSSNSWAVPATESEYRKGIEFLQRYLESIGDVDNPTGQFYTRADNLNYWLGTVDSRLGSLSQRLSASVGRERLNTDLAGDDEARQSTYSPGQMVVKTPWTEVDDVFYEARGSAWALIHILKAMEVDFADVLQKKNAVVSLRQIIRELESTQEPLWSPVILNGDGFGLLANHSLVMASYITRANAAISDLRNLLTNG